MTHSLADRLLGESLQASAKDRREQGLVVERVREALAACATSLRVDLEPTMLDDQGEYLALRDSVPTYDLWPDRVARRRHLEEIAHPERVPRHARHTCGSQYGQHPRPTPPPHVAPDPDAPAPF